MSEGEEIMDRKTTLLEFGKYVSLSVIAMLAVSCYILADTFFVSKSLGTRGWMPWAIPV